MARKSQQLSSICNRCKERPRQNRIGYCRECKNEICRESRKRFKEKYGINERAAIANRDENRIFRRMFQRIRSSSKKRKLEVAISEIHLKEMFKIQLGKCAVSGFPMDLKIGYGRNPYGASVDRIDSDLGYIEGNVQFVCYAVNLMRSNWNMNVFKSFIKAIYEQF